MHINTVHEEKGSFNLQIIMYACSLVTIDVTWSVVANHISYVISQRALWQPIGSLNVDSEREQGSHCCEEE